MKRIVTAFMVTVILVGTLVMAFDVRPVEARGTIYIRADGSIDPITANITSVDNVTYTFTNNILDSIVVERDNIVVDGNGYRLQGTLSYQSKGVDLSGRISVTVKNTQIENFAYGIWFDSSSNYNSINGNNITHNSQGIYLGGSSNNISGNNITANNYYGIHAYSSSNNSISGNTISGSPAAYNDYGIGLEYSDHNAVSGNTFTNDGLSVWNAYQNVVEDNTVNRKPLVYLEGVADYSVCDAGQVILVNCTDIRLENLNLSRTSIGVQLWQTSNSSIAGNTMSYNDYGIWFDSSSNYNSISGNNITANKIEGILLVSSSNNSISGNNITATNYYFGILLGGSSNNSISGNNITHNPQGIYLGRSSNNNIRGNNITANGESSIRLYYSPNNSISRNDITNGYYGILLYYSSSNSVSGNNVTDNEYGIWLEGTSSNRISDNSIAGNLEGIRLYASSSNSILENDMMHNCYGIRFYASSSSNSVVGNSIADSCVYGIFFDFGASVEPSGNNCINHNNFENNTRQVYDVAWEHPEYLPSINIWDNGCEGNYWSNNNGTDSDGDGVGDTPYIIDAVNQDNYPLMNCFWNLADINHDLKVDLKDVFATGKAYGSYPGHPRWNPHCDVNADGKVDLKDYYAVCKSFGKSW